jgi:hypothetical protein
LLCPGCLVNVFQQPAKPESGLPVAPGAIPAPALKCTLLEIAHRAAQNAGPECSEWNFP